MIKCPNCGESYYAELYSTVTCMGWTPIYKDGILINENPNITTTNCRCCNCGTVFSYTNKQEMSSSLDSIVPR